MAARSYVAAILISVFPAAGASDYVGSEVCARCHPTEYRSFARSPMGRSFQPIALKSAPEFGVPVQFVHVKTGRRYRIFQKRDEFLIDELFLDAGRRVVYSDPRAVSYVIGSGNHARSFLVARGNRLYQAPVTFYPQIPGWDMSPGYDVDTHVGFTRRVTADCLFCHAGRVNANRAGDIFEGAHPFAEVAIGCERCHGPGREHLAHPGKAIVNPAKLSPGRREQVCEQCHLFGVARVLQPGRAAADFQSGKALEDYFAIYNYDVSGPQALKVTGHSEQMKRSRCWQGSQDRLWCGSCHEAHSKSAAENSAVFYRNKCLACHQTHGCSRKADVASAASRENNCIECHMPKRPVVESAHVTFTDHEISRHPQAPAREPGTTKLKPLLRAAPSEAVSARDLGFAQLQAAAGRSEFLRLAIETLEPVRKTEVADAEFWQDLGSAYLELQQHDKAEEAFEHALQLDSKSAAAYYSLGYLYQSQKMFAKAIVAYRKAVGYDTGMAEAWGNLAAAYLAIDKKAEAIKSLEAALGLDPGNLVWRRALETVRAEGSAP
jgi:tetratricopeptide (TPR) repeat protein